jgi:hypothetical protein
MTDPLELKFEAWLIGQGVKYNRPERLHSDPTQLDFYLPDFDLYVEIKRFHTPRLTNQLALVPSTSNAMVLMGNKAIDAFINLIQRKNTTNV